jgi:putative ABC transport system substrate-binding protein
MPVIGFLNSASESGFTALAADFRGGLAEEGFVQGTNVDIEWKWADGNYGQQLWQMAADLVRDGVDVIATTGGLVSAQAAVAATETIPILFISGYDPDMLEFVSGTKGPPPNATGVSVEGTDAAHPRLVKFRELLQAHAHLSIGLLVRPGTSIAQREIKEVARRENISVLYATTENDLSTAFASGLAQKLDGLMVAADPFFTSRREIIVALARQNKLPTAYPWREYVEVGGLMSYGVSLPNAYRLIGRYAGKILKGARPRDKDTRIFVDTDFKLAINEQTANALGLQIPQSLRAQGEVI